jgi:hypothetical protein
MADFFSDFMMLAFPDQPVDDRWLNDVDLAMLSKSSGGPSCLG